MNTDQEEFKHLQAEFGSLSPSDPDFDLKFESLFKRMEEIKNRNHGYVPGTEPKPKVQTKPTAESIVSLLLSENSDEDSAYDAEERECPACGGPVIEMGALGNRKHGRCHDAHLEMVSNAGSTSQAHSRQG